MLSRRTVLLGGTTSAAALAVGAGAGVEQGVLPGRPWVQAHLGLNGTAGRIPDVEPGPIRRGTFTSEHLDGAETSWAVVRPPGHTGTLPVVVALHGLGADHTTLLGPEFGLDRYLAAHVADGGEPFAIAMVDGGTSYYHPRPDGTDAGSMVLEEFLPRALSGDSHLLPGPLGFLGWSMGGYGALRLAAELGSGAVFGVVASSPAIWQDPADASTSGFDDVDEYETYSVVGHQEDLADIPVRVDVGTGDPFYRDVQDYVAGFPDDADVTSTFEPGAHDPAYWRRMLPAQLAFLGAAVRSFP